MTDISNLERKYYPEKAKIDQLVMENFIRQNVKCEPKPGSSTTSIINILGRNGICSLKDFYEADIESFAEMYGVGTKVLKIILQMKQKISIELQQEP